MLNEPNIISQGCSFLETFCLPEFFTALWLYFLGKYEIKTGVYIGKGRAVGTGIRNIGPNECADKCTSTTECKAWTFKETISMCWLISDITRTGNAVGWVTGIKLSPYQPNLMNFSTLEKQCDFTIDSTEKSSIATFSIIGMYSTILFSVPLVVRFGKRISLMIDCILSFIAFLLMSFAMNVEMLCMSKFLIPNSKMKFLHRYSHILSCSTTKKLDEYILNFLYIDNLYF